MKLLTICFIVATATALASPVHESRDVPDNAGGEHGHLNYHLGRKLWPRHLFEARALAGPGGNEGPPPTKHDETSPVSNPDDEGDASPHAKEEPVPQSKGKKPVPNPIVNPPKAIKDLDALLNQDDNNSPTHPEENDNNDSPVDKVFNFLDKLFGGSKDEEPSDDWRDQWDKKQPPKPPSVPHKPAPVAPAPVAPAPVGPAPKKPSPSHRRHVKTIVVYETELVVVTSTIYPNKHANVKPTSSPPEIPSPPPADSNSNADAQANQKPPPPVHAPPAKVEQPKPVPKPEAKPAEKAKAPPPPPKPQPPPKKEQPAPAPKKAPAPKPAPKPKDDSQSKNSAQQGHEKPQPTKEQPAGSPGSGLNTDGLPLDFVKDLGCDSDIYKGLSKLHHDIHRTNHSLAPLGWNDTLFEYAKETAETCVYEHSLTPGGGGYGQNIASGDAPGNISAVLTNAFYNLEMMLFFQAIGETWGTDEPDMSGFEDWGHFTQMLWKETTSFACYTASCAPPGQDPLDCDGSGQSYLKNVGCGNGGTQAFFTVCNYYPPGNYAGKYSSVPGPDGNMGFVEMTGNGIIGM